MPSTRRSNSAVAGAYPAFRMAWATAGVFGAASANATCAFSVAGFTDTSTTPGTAAGPLAAYLGVEGLLRGDTLTIEQGTKMGRSSILNVRLSPEPELFGAGVVTLRGVLRLSQ